MSALLSFGIILLGIVVFIIWLNTPSGRKWQREN
jgi:multisubunit Na+/H+ antiporter MnhB subunit